MRKYFSDYQSVICDTKNGIRTSRVDSKQGSELCVENVDSCIWAHFVDDEFAWKIMG